MGTKATAPLLAIFMSVSVSYAAVSYRTFFIGMKMFGKTLRLTQSF
jgi:hypothetical protein